MRGKFLTFFELVIWAYFSRDSHYIRVGGIFSRTFNKPRGRGDFRVREASNSSALLGRNRPIPIDPK